MCGIVGYVGRKRAAPLLVEGLKRLEYRGYDSAGVAVLGADGLEIARAVGRVSVLEDALEQRAGEFLGACGIAHTRWATHGEPSEANAHPHTGTTAAGHTVALVHNGIIENYKALRTWLEGKGHVFTSQTDTEVLAKLVAELYEERVGGAMGGRGSRRAASDEAATGEGGAAPRERRPPGGRGEEGGGGALEAAVQAALREVTGAYAIAAVCEAEPGTIVCARKGSPLLVGLASDGYVVASDPAAIVAHTSQVVALDDYQVVELRADEKNVHPLRTTTIDNVAVTSEVTELEMDLDSIELGGYPHHMLKEIMEQPESVGTCFRGRLDLRDGRVVLGGVSAFSRELVRARRFILSGQGTAYHAALIGEYLFEELARVPARAVYASEFRYRNPLIEEGTILVSVSQSGETADTLAALREARERGALSLGVVNAVGSTIARETDAGVYLHVGPEIGVASTKAFVGQVAVLTLLALYVGRRKSLSQEAVAGYLELLDRVPAMIGRVLEQSDAIKAAVERVVDRDNWLFLGRGYNYPVAMEGALKLKEISYIHAEGMPAAEMKHGPIALIDKGMPVVFVATRGSQYDKVLSNIEEVRARGGRVLAVASEGDETIGELAEFVFRVPDVPDPLQPLLTTVPLQLVAYHAAVLRGLDVDRPRNLAKSVTVE